MMGAAQLSATACLRSGVGVLTVHSPKCGYNIIQSMVPEAKFQADENEMYISDISNPGSFTAIAVGPGISTDNICVTAIENLISELKSPCVIDADAININAGNRELLNQIPRQSILTPHIKEFDRIFGESDNEYKRLQKAIEAAKLYNIIIVLKGAHSAVVLPTGNVHFNSTGNPGMATGGSGDVLTGIILAFIAQKYTPSEAAVLATYIHGLAGDIALSITSAESLTASDIIQNLGNAFRQLHFVK